MGRAQTLSNNSRVKLLMKIMIRTTLLRLSISNLIWRNQTEVPLISRVKIIEGIPFFE